MGRKHKMDRRGKKKDRSKRTGKKQLIVSRAQQYAKMRLWLKGKTQKEIDEERVIVIERAKMIKHMRRMEEDRIQVLLESKLDVKPPEE